MKNIVTLIYLVSLSASLLANGVVIPDSAGIKYLPLISSTVEVSVDGQVAITKTTQVFLNTTQDSLKIQYAFPMPLEASALSLFYKINSQWYEAKFSATEQDSITGGGETTVDYELITYLGENPLVYSFDQPIHSDSTLTVELIYVELLEYKFGKVNYDYPNDYDIIADSIDRPVDMQSIQFSLLSDRTITDIKLLSHTADSVNNSGTEANIFYSAFEQKADQDYYIQYSLSQEELGLYSYSTYLPDSLIPDTYGNGFFMFVAEPDPSENQKVIDKVFTLIIDRSGSMSGDKIVQARNAAKFITQNLNLGDKFNIIDFASDIKSFRGGHVDFTGENESAALAYIDNLIATGSTNISGAFGEAIPQFSAASDNTANIIIFFTDGQQTAGITDTDQLIAYVDELVVQNEAKISIFTFGIGASTNERLLTTLAANHNGLADFLGNDELEEKITEFYLLIRNPVLINTSVIADPDLLSEIYPSKLPNLYKGQQMILAGRYDDPSPFELTLSGEAFGDPVFYAYEPVLSDSLISQYAFIPKIWAKQKIAQLLTEYYQLNPSTSKADSIKSVIIDISLDYRVISPFTSFKGSFKTEGGNDQGGTGVYTTNVGTLEFDAIPEASNKILLTCRNYPNPFNHSTTIAFEVKGGIHGLATISIYDVLGRLVAEYIIAVEGDDEYEFIWNPAESHPDLAAGLYGYTIRLNGETLKGMMIYLE
ncbi:MAG: VWA domain-containing protein [Bacteroidales bacterium]|nr:VWA domain-containing protein [Bacteroidales bacterium]